MKKSVIYWIFEELIKANWKEATETEETSMCRCGVFQGTNMFTLTADISGSRIVTEEKRKDRRRRSERNITTVQ